MSLFLAQFGDSSPDSKALILLALAPVILGAILFHFLNKRDKADLGYRFRLAALLPVAVGVVLGAMLSYRMATDYGYQQFHLIGTKRALLHYAVLAVNLLGAVGILVWNSKSSQGPKYDF